MNGHARRLGVGAFLCLLSSAGADIGVTQAGAQPAAAAATIVVNCDRQPHGALQRAIDAAQRHHTILVSGVCHENVSIDVDKHLITVDGQGQAVIVGPDPALNGFLVRGRGITIRGFTITGGRVGVDVGRGASAVIDGNTIEHTGRWGITIGAFGTANIVNNVIQNNPLHGILLNGNSFAFIGFRTADDTVASPNLIRNNGTHGIVITLSASARIAGNIITGNVLNGIQVERASQATISDNTLDSNGRHGVFVTENSGVNLGSDAGTDLFSRSNRTTAHNGGYGIACRLGAYVNGRIGTLTGTTGSKNIGASCHDSLDSPDTF